MSVWSHEYYRSMLPESCTGYYDSMISDISRVDIPDQINEKSVAEI